MIEQSLAHPAPHPNGNTRETRALALYRERADEIEQIAPDVYLVPACSARGGFYKVDYEAETCSCPDAEFHPEASCKHILCRHPTGQAPEATDLLGDCRGGP